MSIRNLVPFALVMLGACDTMEPGVPGNLVPRTVAEDPTLPAVELNGTRFHAETMGNPANPAIVFLHGGPGSDYRSLLALAGRLGGYSLADDYYLVFWDQRGAGLSARHDPDVLTLDVYTADLDAIVDHYSPNRPVYLIGESWGGMYATQYINTHPGRVAGAVLIEPGPMDGPTAERVTPEIREFRLGAEWLNDYAWASQFFSPDDHARMDYELMVGMRGSQPRFHQREDVNPSPVWRLGAAVARDLMLDGQDERGVFVYDFTSNLQLFTTPVLFIAGGLSEVLGEPLQREQVRRYPSASLTVVPGAGHDVAWTHTPEVLTLVRTYLNTVRGGAQ